MNSLRQWIVFGIAFGLIAALALNSDTRSIVSTEITTGTPFGRSLNNPIQQVEFDGYGHVDPAVVDAADRAAGNAKDDVSVQIADAVFLSSASAFESYVNRVNPPNYSLNIGNDPTFKADLQLKRCNAIRKVLLANPNSPLTYAAYIRELLTADLKPNRSECAWIRVQNAKGELVSAVQPNVLDGGLVRNQPDVEDQSQPGATALNSAQLQAIESAAQLGMQCDRTNSFFPMVLAYIHYTEHKDAQAIRDVDHAGCCQQYDEYSFDLARGWQRLDTAVYGTPDSSAEGFRYENASAHGCEWIFRLVGQITVWKAIELEHYGRYADGLALRMRIASVGAEMSTSSPNSPVTGTMTNLVYMSATGFGGKHISSRPGRGQSPAETPIEYASRCSTLYLKYLENHGFTKQANWYKPIFHAQYKLAYFDDNNSSAFQSSSPWTKPAAYQAAGYYILAEITLLVIVGLVLGFVGYLRRFAPRREVFWSRAQWSVVFSGFVMSLSCVAFTVLLYKGSAVWPLVVGVFTMVAVIQLGVRRFMDSDSSFALLLHSLCFALCAIVVTGTTAFELVTTVLALAQQTGSTVSTVLPDNAWIAIAQMAIPELLLCIVIARCRVRYQGVPSGLFYGTRRVILPAISLLLVIWAVDIAVTAGIEKDNRHNISVSLGLMSDVQLK